MFKSQLNLLVSDFAIIMGMMGLWHRNGISFLHWKCLLLAKPSTGAVGKGSPLPNGKMPIFRLSD